jgi:hypothetical protein
MGMRRPISPPLRAALFLPNQEQRVGMRNAKPPQIQCIFFFFSA